MATPRAGVIPTSIKDETGAIARQQAEANDRMAQLFYTLLAKREDRLFQAQLRREMAEDSDRRRYDYFDYTEAARNNRGQDNRPSTPGAQPNAVGDDNAAPSGGGATTPTMKGAPAILDHRRFSSNTSAPANVQTADAGYDGPTDVSASARSSFAQASPQQLQEAKASNKVSAAGGNAKRTPSTSLPRVSNRRPAPQVVFRGVTPEVRAAWEDAEQKNGLPRGQLLFTYGIETDGGRLLGNADGTGPQGPFQWTPALLREKGLTVHDAQDLIKMGYHTAKNMAENHAQLVKRTTAGGQAIQLTNDAGDMPSWHILHQWGRTSGPNIVAAGKLNPGMPLITQLPKQVKRKDGTVGGPGEWLSANGIHNPDATIAHEYARVEKRGAPYRTAALTGVGFPDASAPTTSQGAPAGPQVAGGQPPSQQAPQNQPPRPPANVPNAVDPNVQNVGPLRAIRTDLPQHRMEPRAAAGMQQLIQEFPNIRVTSGYRGGNPDSQHYQGKAFDADFSKLSIPEKQAATRRAIELGAIGIGNYGNDSMHFDWRTGWPKVAWGPNKSHKSLHRAAPWFQEIAHAHRTGGDVGPSNVQTARAPAATQARPTEASAQKRGPIDKYEYTENLPSEGKRDVTMDFRGPTSYAQRGAPDTAQAKPTPTPQQQPSLPQGIRPQTPYTAPPGWPTGQEPAVPVQPSAPQPVPKPGETERIPYYPDPTTVPQDLPFEANYPAPPTVNMPMPPRRPADMQSVATQAMQQPGGAMFGGEAQLDAPMPRARPQSGAQSVDEAGFIPEMAVPQGNEFAPDAMAMPAGNEYAPDAMAMPAGNEYAPPPPPVMAVPEGNEYAADVMAAPEGNEFEVPNMAAAAGNEFAPAPKLPGANLTMPTKPFSMQERRMGAQAPPQPLPADYMSPTQRIQQALGGPNGAPIGGGDTSMGGVPDAPAWWPPPHERWKMQNAARDALFAKARQAFQPDAQQATPPIADIPMPPEGDAGGAPVEATQSRMLQALRQAASGGPPQGAPPVSDIPLPPQGDGGPSTDDTTMDKLARLFKRGTDAISGAPPQDAPPTSDIPPPVAGDAGPGVPQDAGPSRLDWITEGAKRDLPAIYPYTPGGAARTAIDKVVELFKQRGRNGGATPAPPADAQATPTAPTFQPRKVKVQNIGPGGQPVLPDGEPIKIPNPNQPRGMANTPLPDFGTGGGGAKPTTATPPPPKPGAGKAVGFRQWVMPDGTPITTKPGEEPPAGAKRVQ